MMSKTEKSRNLLQWARPSTQQIDAMQLFAAKLGATCPRELKMKHEDESTESVETLTQQLRSAGIDVIFDRVVKNTNKPATESWASKAKKVFGNFDKAWIDGEEITPTVKHIYKNHDAGSPATEAGKVNLPLPAEHGNLTAISAEELEAFKIAVGQLRAAGIMSFTGREQPAPSSIAGLPEPNPATQPHPGWEHRRYHICAIVLQTLERVDEGKPEPREGGVLMERRPTNRDTRAIYAAPPGEPHVVVISGAEQEARALQFPSLEAAQQFVYEREELAGRVAVMPLLRNGRDEKS